MQVILTPEYEQALRQQIYDIVIDEVAKARRDALLDGLLNQKEIAEVFNVSTTTIRAWEKLGMPHGSMGSQSKFYDKQQCKKWVLSQKL